MARCVAAGILLAGSLPPWGFWPLAFGGIVLLDGLLADRPRSSRVKRMGATSFVMFAITLFWMKELTAPGYVIATALFAAMFALSALLIPPGRGRHLALPAVWALAEMAKARWPFAGTAVAVGVVLAMAVQRRWRGVGVGAIALALLLGGAAIAPDGHDTGDTVRIAVVQGGGKQGTQAVYSDMNAVFDRHLAAANTITKPVDLVLWPEDVIDLDEGDITDEDNPKGIELSALARRLDATIIAGVVQTVDESHFRNFSIVVHPDGSFGSRYDKVHRVPFGEYVPFRSLVAPFAGPALTSRDAVPGTGPAVLQTAQGPYGVVISWEVFFGDRARSAIRSGAEILTNPTNGSTYTGTLVQTQQVAASRLRAVESGRWVLQAAPTGFSAVISPSGHVVERSSISERRILRAVVPRRTGQTFYIRYGDPPPTLLAFAMVALAWIVARPGKLGGRFRRHSAETTPASPVTDSPT